jgi:hypothetical protein
MPVIHEKAIKIIHEQILQMESICSKKELSNFWKKERDGLMYKGLAVKPMDHVI